MSLTVPGFGKTVTLGQLPQPVSDGVAKMTDLEIEEALKRFQSGPMDDLIQRLSPQPPKPQAPTGGADMVRAEDQNAWKWDGNKVRYLTDAEKDADAGRERLLAARRRSQLERAQSQRARNRMPQSVRSQNAQATVPQASPQQPPTQPQEQQARPTSMPASYALATLMQTYSPPAGFYPDPQAQQNCPPERPFCNPVFIDRTGRTWKPGEPAPGMAPPKPPQDSPEMRAVGDRRSEVGRRLAGL